MCLACWVMVDVLEDTLGRRHTPGPNSRFFSSLKSIFILCLCPKHSGPRLSSEATHVLLSEVKSEKSQAQKQRTFPLQEFGACRQSVGISWTPLHLVFWSQPLCTGINCDSLPPHPQLSDFLAVEHGPKQISKRSFLICNLFQRAPCCSLSNSNQTVKSNFILCLNQNSPHPNTHTHHHYHGQCNTIFFQWKLQGLL